MREKGTQTNSHMHTHWQVQLWHKLQCSKVAQMFLKETFSVYTVNVHTLLLQSMEKAGCLLN